VRKKWIIAIIIVICTTIFIIINVTQMNKSETVHLVATQEGVIEETIFASGKLNSTTETVQYVAQSGLVKQMDIQLGDHVVVGQTLLTMDTKESEKQLLIEENNKQMIIIERDIFKKQKVATAREQLQAGIDPQSIMNPDELELYTLRLKGIELSIIALKASIADNALISTAEGVVTEVHIKEGQTVAQGTAAFTIVDQSKLRVKAYLNELDVSKVSKGMEAKITGDAFTASYLGKVSYLAPHAVPVDASSRDVAVELWVDLDAPDAQLRPGYNATVEIGISQMPSLLVPLTAIRHTGDKTVVFLVEEGMAVEREVTTGDDDGVNIEIQTGLQAGDEVISELTDAIAVGNKVKEQ
jgi:RND family efflux transporter MFP subunit